MQGGSTLPDPVLKVFVVILHNLGGPGIHFSNAAFTADSAFLAISGAPGYPLEMSAMALGTVPSARSSPATGTTRSWSSTTPTSSTT